MKAQFVIKSNSMFNIPRGDVSAYDAFKAIFTKYFNSYNIRPQAAKGIEVIEVFKTTASNLAKFEEEALAAGIEFVEAEVPKY